MIAAIYCRLSKEDEERIIESESIQNQKSMLIEYAAERGWDVYNIYSDEDYSGADRDRPGFCSLIADAKQGKFDTIICKSQHRFARDVEIVEKYIHHYFPIWGIRFIAVTDNADTEVKGNKKSRQINGLINEWYLEDLSENIRAVFNHKRKNGQYIGGFPLYGYKKHPMDKNKLVVDPIAATVVKRIYALYLEGHGSQHIARILNADGVLNPTKHKALAGVGYTNGSLTNEYGLWNKVTIGRILRDQMYTGDLVQGRRKKLSYKSKKFANVPEDQWFIVPDTHEAIIDKETFARVQGLKESRRRSDGTGQVHMLAAKVYCMDCGSIMAKNSTWYKKKRLSYLRCKLHAAKESLCSNHTIRLDALEAEVIARIKSHIANYYDAGNVERLLEQEKQSDYQSTLRTELKKVEADIAKRDKAVQQLYLDKVSGVFDEDIFLSMSRAFIAERKALQDKTVILENELDVPSEKPDARQQAEIIQKWLDVDVLSREMVADFIDSIQIGAKDSPDGQVIQINWAI